MNFTDEQKIYIKRRLRELKKQKGPQGPVGPQKVYSTKYSFIGYAILVLFAAYFTALCLWDLDNLSYKQKNPKVVVEKPFKPPVPVPLPNVAKPGPIAKKVVKTFITKVEKIEGGWRFKLNKPAIEAVKKGAFIKLHVDYCEYWGKEVDEDGYVTIKPEWTPPIERSRISAGIFRPTDKFGGGYYVSSLLIKIKRGEANTVSAEQSRESRVEQEAPLLINNLPEPKEPAGAYVAQSDESPRLVTGIDGGSNPSIGSNLIQSVDNLNQVW